MAAAARPLQRDMVIRGFLASGGGACWLQIAMSWAHAYAGWWRRRGRGCHLVFVLVTLSRCASAVASAGHAHIQWWLGVPEAVLEHTLAQSIRLLGGVIISPVGINAEALTKIL